MQLNRQMAINLDYVDEEVKYFNIINNKYDFNDAINVLDNIDWDFKNFNTQYLTHKFHSYPARFIPQIPLTFIKLFTKEKDTVLDPFCGCGTTMVESFYNNRNSIGNDFNPLAVLISKVKTTKVENEKLDYLLSKFPKSLDNIKVDKNKVQETLNNLPKRKISGELFNYEIVYKLISIKQILEQLKEEGNMNLYDIGALALSSTVWSYVETKILGDIYNSFIMKLHSIIKELKKINKLINYNPKVEIINGDSRMLKVDSESIDLIVTSPPYVNALDYYRTHMYNMFWLNIDIDNFKKHEIGSHSHFVSNRFRLLSEYLGDMLRSLIEMNRVLKKGKICTIVIGNSSLEYELIESYKYFEDMARFVGFLPLRKYFRNIDKTKKYTNADVGKIDDEVILVLKKIDNVSVLSTDDLFISEVVKNEMNKFKAQIEKIQGTGIKGWKKPTKERLLKNANKIEEAIKLIPKDIKFKE
ncbi:DNA methyltransferase [Thermoanaerobacterium thermosaccharolyticum]|uniref:DNA methyltransferase n=1 Tax=Thermoanaerobacterium thermosaccharolyticum TaxID=1517 RepID=UPI002FD96ACD